MTQPPMGVRSTELTYTSPSKPSARQLSVRVGVLALATTLLACTSGEEETSPTPSAAELEGVFTADMRYETRDGESYTYAGPSSMRINTVGDGVQCIIGGLEADQCAYDGSPDSFAAQSVLNTQYDTYDRVRTLTLDGTHADAEGRLIADFTNVYDYYYHNGAYGQRVYTGTITFARVQQFDETVASGITLLGEFNQFEAPARGQIAHEESGAEGIEVASSSSKVAVNVRVEGNYAYVVRLGDGLRIVDISNPAQPRAVGHAHPDDVGGWYYNDVKLFQHDGKQYAAVSDSHIGMVIYDVSVPSNPTFVSSFFPDLMSQGDILNNHTLAIEGTTAYLANYGGSLALDPAGEGESGGLLMVDISDPTEPRELGRWLTAEVGGSFTHDLFVKDNIAYLASWEAGLVMLDVHNPAEPFVLGNFTYERMTSHSVWVTEAGGRTVAVHGDEDYGSHIRIVDVDPDSAEFMTQIGEFMMRPQVSVHNIMAIGAEVIASHYQDGVRILDIRDPTKPTLKAWYNTFRGHSDPTTGYSFYEGVCGVDVVGDKLYLADINRGLMVLQREQ